MKYTVQIILKTALAFTVFFSSINVQAKEPLLIVTDPWPPFALTDDQGIKGTDVEIIKAVFAQLKIPISVKFYPWKRCLAMVQYQKADAILDVSITPERKSWFYFPNEPVSEGVTVFFIKKENQLSFTGLRSLNNLRAGAILGYSYCKEIDQSPFLLRADRVVNLEQNFNKLLANRIDFLIEVEAVGFYKAKTMNISDQIKIIPNAYYCRGGNYLGFSKKTGYQTLSKTFGKALHSYKSTKSYQQILQKYGLENPQKNQFKNKGVSNE